MSRDFDQGTSHVPGDYSFLGDAEIWKLIDRCSTRLLAGGGYFPFSEEDLAQETGIKLWRDPNFKHLPQRERKRVALKATFNKFLSMRRQAHAVKRGGSETVVDSDALSNVGSPEASSEPSQEDIEHISFIPELLRRSKRFSKEHLDVFWSAIVATREETASRFHTNKNNVKQIVHQVRGFLRRDSRIRDLYPGFV